MKISQLKGGAALSYVTIFLTNIVGLLLTPFIIRSLGQSEYGLYTMIGALVGYMSVLDFGLNNTIIRYVAKYKLEDDKHGEENFLAHSFIIYFCISILVTILGVILYYNLDDFYRNSLSFEQIEKAKLMMLILTFNLAISLPGGAFSGICFGYEEFILPKITNIIKYIIRSILVLVILLYGADSVGLVVLDTIMNIVVIGINIYIVFKVLKVRIRLHNINKSLFISILGFSLWLFVFALVNQLRWRFGQFLIGMFYSTSIVAVYAIGSTLGNYYGAFSSAISSVFLPKAIKMTVQNVPKKELTNTFIKISRIILIVLLYIFGGFVICGQYFVHIWVGNGFEMAYYYAVVIMIGLTPILSQGFANNILEAKNLLAYRGVIMLSLTITGTILGYFLLKAFGVMEMIFSVVIFMLIERVVMFFYYQKKTNLDMYRYYKEILPLFICCLLLTSTCLLLDSFLFEDNLIGNLILGLIYTVCYGFCCVLVMTQYEKTLTKSVFFKIPFMKKFQNN
ncbi:lipopolysaccharide biosynthesis protein [Algibacter miyuki]|uniref:Lipopolysaccharide biosynthesis protein n=1 Tax=Algibacter miyuki TaxID=1306933 RepID=A0ABV5GYD8_9FLAO|nr:oligosaccharide flippase family protein [Algibacter miyuki]MDN3667159.1 oligosaccharide flippase family protein [Algibacter miyuki]